MYVYVTCELSGLKDYLDFRLWILDSAHYSREIIHFVNIKLND